MAVLPKITSEHSMSSQTVAVQVVLLPDLTLKAGRNLRVGAFLKSPNTEIISPSGYVELADTRSLLPI
ncbi:uncharacterized protein ARMOST_02605 [Armillaria ostoyae]|uniref:Uncharacterized protein n=1 Tax=Armillaria ostoyae TaxID=47428 RepID=A0A284QS57_ARMOS|nr:uncharacterized protein ARMOST_02605 [Armillaria ostoyae]